MSPRYLLSKLVLGAALPASAACGGEGSGPDGVGEPAALSVVTAPTVIEQDRTLEPAVRVEIRDASGRLVESPTAVTLRLAANPSGASLAGSTTVAAVDGIASFADVRVPTLGAALTIVASSGNVASAPSAPLDVVRAFAQMDAGGFRTCALTEGGAAWCWSSWEAPYPIQGDLRFSSLAVGYFACGLVQGRAWCWNDGSHFPVAVSGGPLFTAVDVGNLHACGLAADGAAWCWGDNLYGSLGDGTTTSSAVPVPVQTALRFRSITVGAWHTCGITEGGTAHCWGLNQYGMLGDGTRLDRGTPVAVVGGLAFTQLAAGRYHTCGITAGSAIHCWGRNQGGALGDGTEIDSDVPVRVLNPVALSSLSAGDDHACGIDDASAAWCWGDNRVGSIGDGGYANRPTPVEVLTSQRFIAVTSGMNLQTCGIRTGGAAFCWGSGYGLVPRHVVWR